MVVIKKIKIIVENKVAIKTFKIDKLASINNLPNDNKPKDLTSNDNKPKKI